MAQKQATPTTGATSSPAAGNNAFFAVLINSDQHYKRQDWVASAAHVLCNARSQGSQIPFHLIYGGGLGSAEELAFLGALGWRVHDNSHEQGHYKEIYKPLYNKSEAARRGRRWIDDNGVQSRTDGWATYFKFDAWKATQYDHVLVSDLDVTFNGNPDNLFSQVPEDDVFQAFPETALRQGYMGLNTHLMVLKPSLETYAALVTKARNGDYVPYTNSEQDILEDMYPAARFATGHMAINSVPHNHPKCRRWCDDGMLRALHKENPRANCDDFDRTCPP